MPTGRPHAARPPGGQAGDLDVDVGLCDRVGDALVTLKNGKQAHVTMHVLEGSREEIENQLRQSIEAFFDFYPEI